MWLYSYDISVELIIVICKHFIYICYISNVRYHWLLSCRLLSVSLVCEPQCISGTDTWQRVNTAMPVKSPRFALFDLAEGKSYSFRVRCCNSAGVGEPSLSTEEITVGDKLGEPASSASTSVQLLHTGSLLVLCNYSSLLSSLFSYNFFFS